MRRERFRVGSFFCEAREFLVDAFFPNFPNKKEKNLFFYVLENRSRGQNVLIDSAVKPSWGQIFRRRFFVKFRFFAKMKEGLKRPKLVELKDFLLARVKLFSGKTFRLFEQPLLARGIERLKRPKLVERDRIARTIGIPGSLICPH